MTDDLGLDALPLGVFSTAGSPPRVGAALGDGILDLADVLDREVFGAPSLAPLLERGPDAWARAREDVRRVAESGAAPVVPAASATMHLPLEIADFVDFFSSLEHALNAGRILRSGTPPLSRAWRHVPIGYHGRAGTVVVSGTPVRRPSGHLADGDDVRFGPTRKLDVEVELGFLVGAGSELGSPVAVDDFERHVFGAVLLLDWSARDIQAFEYQPLGPFLGKSFATTIGPWVMPLAALRDARVPAPPRDPAPLPHLVGRESWSLDVALEWRINGTVVSRPQYAPMYWDAAQQLAHLTSNGASLRVGDLYGTGTLSTPGREGWGSLLELTENGTRPLEVGGEPIGFLRDGDEVELTGFARTSDGRRIGFGTAVGRIAGGAA